MTHQNKNKMMAAHTVQLLKRNVAFDNTIKGFTKQIKERTIVIKPY